MARKPRSSPEALDAFAALAIVLTTRASSEITEVRWFGRVSAKVGDELFLALDGDGLAARVGGTRANRLVNDGSGESFDPAGQGHPLQDWVRTKAPPGAWLPLAEEALDYVERY